MPRGGALGSRAAWGTVALMVLASQARAQTLGNPALPAALMEPGTAIQWITKVKSSCDAPTYDKATGNLYFTEARGAGTAHWPIWKVDTRAAGNPAAIFYAQSEQGRGLGFDAQGRLVATQKGKLIRLTAQGTWETIAASGKTAAFSEVNDFAFDDAEGIYFTGRDANVYYRDASGTVTVSRAGLQAGNGILFIREKSLLLVNDIVAARVLEFPVEGPGKLGAPREFAKVTRPDGLAMDELGNLYVANNSDGIVHVLNPAAKEIGKITMTPPSDYEVCSGGTCNATHAKFGGEDGMTLYITGDGGLFSLRMKVKGRDSGPVGLRPSLIQPRAPRRSPRRFDALARQGRAAPSRPPTPRFAW